MKRFETLTALAIAVVAVQIISFTVHADVRADQKTHVEFAGTLGRMVGFFGGKAAKEGVTSSVAVRGDRKTTLNDQTGQIIDLAEEKVYDLDMRKKTYRVTTFEELRHKMEEAQKRAADSERKDQQATQTQKEPQVEVDVDVKNTGQQKTINGFDTHETIVTITVREKGKTLEQGGGMVMTSDSWLAPRIAAMKEVSDFDRRYAQKLYGSIFAGGASPEQMAAAMAMYPMMKQAMGRMTTEGAKLDGTPILTTVTMDSVKSQEQIAQDTKQKDDDSKSSGVPNVGSFLGGLAKKAAAKKANGSGDDASNPRSTFMTSTLEVLKVATDVTAADVAMPTGFKDTK